MANLSTVIKSEITRLARTEIKAAVDPLRKAGAGYRREIAELKRHFNDVRNIKPKASRADSSEVYLVATGFKGA